MIVLTFDWFFEWIYCGKRGWDDIAIRETRLEMEAQFCMHNGHNIRQIIYFNHWYLCHFQLNLEDHVSGMSHIFCAGACLQVRPYLYERGRLVFMLHLEAAPRTIASPKLLMQFMSLIELNGRLSYFYFLLKKYVNFKIILFDIMKKTLVINTFKVRDDCKGAPW